MLSTNLLKHLWPFLESQKNVTFLPIPDHINFQTKQNKSISGGNSSTWGFGLSQDNFDSLKTAFAESHAVKNSLALHTAPSSMDKDSEGKQKRRVTDRQVTNPAPGGTTRFQKNQEWEVPNLLSARGAG